MAKYSVDSNAFGDQLIVRGRWHKSLEKILTERNIRQLCLDYSYGWRGTDLEFLQKVPHLVRLSILDSSGVDVSGIGFLPKLKRLRIMIWDMPSRPLPFEKLPDLESCHMQWNVAFESVLRCASLQDLDISDMKKVPVLDISHLKHLKRFWITRASGLKEVIFAQKSQLDDVALRRIPSLQTVHSWTYMERLRHLRLAQCRRLDVSMVAGARNLRQLNLDNMGTIKSLRFIEHMQLLERMGLSGSTEIEDGDLAFVTSLPNLRGATFPPKRHYNLTPQEASQILHGKGREGTS